MTLYAVCGEPGVGKTSVARFLARETDGLRLSTDEIRKELFGSEPTYSTEESQKTYDEMFERAREALLEERTVVLDATFMLRDGRERARTLAQECTYPYSFELVRVVCYPDTVEERIERRDGISDADIDVYRSIRDRFEPVEMEHTVINNSGEQYETMSRIRRKLL